MVFITCIQCTDLLNKQHTLFLTQCDRGFLATIALVALHL